MLLTSASRLLGLLIASILIVWVALLGARHIAFASHSQSYVFPGAPYSGTWNLGNNAPPSTHHRPWVGDWAVDYYQSPGVQGNFYAASNDGTASGIVTKGSSCLSPSDWAGWAYKFQVQNNSGNRGWYLLAHVSDYGPPNPLGPPYQLADNQTVTNGTLVGWTAYWGGGSGVGTCYQVNFASSNHFHVEMKNSTAVGHTSCYYDWGISRQMTVTDWMGILGANTTTAPTACP